MSGLPTDFTLFIDLDGVLVDFVRGVIRKFNSPLRVEEVQWHLEPQFGFADPAEFWAALGANFWATLSCTPESYVLLAQLEQLVGHGRIALLSSPGTGNHAYIAREGKARWVENHLPPCYSRSLVLAGAKHNLAGPHKVLIDDHDENIDAWSKAGGVAVPVPRPWNRWHSQCGPGGSFDVAAVLSQVSTIVSRMRGT